MFWHPKRNLPKLAHFKELTKVYQSTQDPAYFIIVGPEGWIGAYERYEGQARTVRNLPWCGDPMNDER